MLKRDACVVLWRQRQNKRGGVGRAGREVNGELLMVVVVEEEKRRMGYGGERR